MVTSRTPPAFPGWPLPVIGWLPHWSQHPWRLDQACPLSAFPRPGFWFRVPSNVAGTSTTLQAKLQLPLDRSNCHPRFLNGVNLLAGNSLQVLFNENGHELAEHAGATFNSRGDLWSFDDCRRRGLPERPTMRQPQRCASDQAASGLAPSRSASSACVRLSMPIEPWPGR